MEIRHLARMTIASLIGKNRFASYIICEDERRQLVILVSQTSELGLMHIPYIQVSKTTRIDTGKATMRAVSRGRTTMNESDLYLRQQYRYRIITDREINVQKPMEVYLASYKSSRETELIKLSKQ